MNGETLRQSGISSVISAYFKKNLESLGFAAAEFRLHSLRAGGVTAAANVGIPRQTVSVTSMVAIQKGKE